MNKKYNYSQKNNKKQKKNKKTNFFINSNILKN